MPEDSDIFYALWRAAFVVAFAILPSFNPSGLNTSLFMEIMLVSTGGSCLLLFVAWRLNHPLPFYRQLVIINDLLLVTATITNLGPIASPLYEVYGLIIVAAAMWFRRTGAFIAAIAAITLNGMAQQVNAGGAWYPTFNGTIMWNTGAPFLLIFAFFSGYLMRLRDQEHVAVIKMQEELRLARTLQEAMLPANTPDIPGYDIAVRFEPAREVGGDVYDVRDLSANQTLVCLADLAGHSVYGLVHLSLVHSHLRAAADEGLPPAEIARSVNEHVYEALQPDSYAAVFIGILDHENHALKFVNCGHLPPLLLRRGATDEVEELFSGGIVLGGRKHVRYRQKQVNLGIGDTAVFYTDGIAEARDGHGEFFGTEGVVAVAQRNASASAEDLAEAILSAAHRFSSDVREDDVTLIVLRRTA